MKQFCQYEVIDFKTGLVLVTGRKIKDFKNYESFRQLGSFKDSVLSKDTITCLCRCILLFDRLCLIVYYVHSKPSKKMLLLSSNVVTGVGKIFHLSGKEYTDLYDISFDIVQEFSARF